MVSVCMATYNGGKYLNEQIDSILAQLSMEDELIICDDLSNDNTRELIESYNDSRIKLHVNKERKGIVKNFEQALCLATQPFVFLSDQDDIWDKEKIAVSLKYLEEYDLVLSNYNLINGNEKVPSSFFKKNKAKRGFFNNLIKNSFIGSCMGFKRELVMRCTPFPKYIPMHDWWIGLIATLHFKYKICDDVLVLHRIHEGNNSTTSQPSSFSFFMKIYLRIMMVFCLLSKKV